MTLSFRKMTPKATFSRNKQVDLLFYFILNIAHMAPRLTINFQKYPVLQQPQNLILTLEYIIAKPLHSDGYSIRSNPIKHKMRNGRKESGGYWKNNNMSHLQRGRGTAMLRENRDPSKCGIYKMKKPW